ncbi:ribokinase, partial [bacterium]
AMALQIRGARRVVVTLGANGALLLDEGSARRVPAPKVAPVDTTAAGDTFAGALSVALGEGSTLDEAAGFATRAASLAVTRRGAQTSIPRRDEL